MPWSGPPCPPMASAVAALVLIQVAAGFVNVLLLAPVWMQLVHLVLADLVWIAFVLLAGTPAAPWSRIAPPLSFEVDCMRGNRSQPRWPSRSFLLNASSSGTRAGRPAGLYAARPSGSRRSGRPSQEMTAAQLKDYLTFVASDEMEGREHPVPRARHDGEVHRHPAVALGGEARPATNGSYFQPIELAKRDSWSERRDRGDAGQANVRLRQATSWRSPTAGDSERRRSCSAGTAGSSRRRTSTPTQGLDPKGKIVILTQGGFRRLA